MLETLMSLLVTPVFGITLVAIVVLAMLLHHWRQLALIKSGLIKKQAARGWRVDYERLRSGLWLAALGGVIAYALQAEIGNWTAFWLLVALLGVGQVIASLFGRDRWLWSKKIRRHWQD